jgi:hypothetical protein
MYSRHARKLNKEQKKVNPKRERAYVRTVGLEWINTSCKRVREKKTKQSPRTLPTERRRRFTWNAQEKEKKKKRETHRKEGSTARE